MGQGLGSAAMSLPPSTGDRHHRDVVVRMTELTVTTHEIVGETFSNCRIIGPAVLVPLEGTKFLHCSWDAPGANAIYWEIPPGRNFVVGAVAIINCTFSSCSFSGIGLAGPPELRAILTQGLGETD